MPIDVCPTQPAFPIHKLDPNGGMLRRIHKMPPAHVVEALLVKVILRNGECKASRESILVVFRCGGSRVFDGCHSGCPRVGHGGMVLVGRSVINL